MLTSLCAEGTPVLALEMCRVWKAQGVDFRVCTFQDSPSDLAPEFTQLGIAVDCLSIRFHGYLKYPSLCWRVFQYARVHRLNALLSFPFGWHSYVAWGGRIAGVRTIVAHAGNFPPIHSPVAKRKLRATLALGAIWHTDVACCSDHVRNGLIRYLGMPVSSLHTVYNGVDFDAFKHISHVRQLPVAIRVGMVARFELHKDQPALLGAVAMLRSRGTKIRLDLVGDGSRRSEYEEKVKNLGISEVVDFRGVRRDIPDLLRGWDLFVFSVTPDEGLGIALIEALAAGVPVIASDVGACREVLNCPDYGVLGELVPAGDAGRLAEAILNFAADPEPWWERARRAEVSVRSRFSIEKMAEEYLALLGAA